MHALRHGHRPWAICACLWRTARNANAPLGLGVAQRSKVSISSDVEGVVQTRRTCISSAFRWAATDAVHVVRDGFKCAEETSRDSVFGSAAPDLDAAGIQHTYREKELEWRNLHLQSVPKRSDESAEVLLKKMRHRARGRGWMEASEFLVGFFDSPFPGRLDHDGLKKLDRLLQCDDMFLMKLAVGRPAPEELQSEALDAMHEYFKTCGQGMRLMAASLPPGPALDE
mmetsp:Transcript_14219/g.39160  ORF Transcript_14219/g.39160 Transcript_14219/m.39160 type:complete len:227 (+) Transcript_14219:117-797(+)